MEWKATQRLSPDEAKARLRQAMVPSEALSWVWSYPKEGVLAAFILGLILGMSPTARDACASGMIALLKRSRL